VVFQLIVECCRWRVVKGMGKWEKHRLGAVAAVQIWELGRVIRYHRHTQIMADWAVWQKRFWSFLCRGKFYLFIGTWRGTRCEECRTISICSERQWKSVTREPDTTYDIEGTRSEECRQSFDNLWNGTRYDIRRRKDKDKISLRRSIDIDSKSNKKTKMSCRTYTTKMLSSGHLRKEGKTSPREHRYGIG
jgi:hypothetical protein